MKKSVSIPDELVYKVMDTVYVNRAKNPTEFHSFSEIVVEALKKFLEPKTTEVTVCKK